MAAGDLFECLAAGKYAGMSGSASRLFFPFHPLDAIRSLMISDGVATEIPAAGLDVLSPEDELLWCCARVSPSPEAVETIRQRARGPLDWDRVFQLSWWHRIRPLTYRHLCEHAPDQIPAPIVERFIEQTSELSDRGRRLVAGLHDVAAIFEQAKTRLLFFKGPALAIDAYGDVGLRECGDLDLLLHRDDFPQAASLLKSHGFRSAWERPPSEALRRVFACEFDRRGVQLDVHWDLAPGWLRYRVDFDSFWEAGVPISSGGHYARKMRPEDLLIVLCVHGAKHWWERLRWIADIAELVNRGQIRDWDRVAAASNRAHSRRSVQLGLWLAHRLLDADIPPSVAERWVQDKRTQRLGMHVVRWLGQAEQAAASRNLRERFSFRMGLCERWRDRAPQIWHYLRERPSRRSGGE